MSAVIDDETATPVTFADVRDAAERIRPYIQRTPLLRFPELDAATGGRIFVKPECLQITGSFKLRGGTSKLSALSEAERANGVVAWSSGNHGQAVAMAAKLFGVPATIVMPEDAPRIKLEKTRGHGATIVTFNRKTESREEIARAIAAKSGAVLVPSYDDKYVIAGQGTSGLEVMEDAEARGITLDSYVVCTGGGGLMAGSSLAIHEYSPDTQIYSAEPAGYDDHARSFAAGKRVGNAADAPDSICDALLSPEPGEITFAVNRHHAAGGLVVSEDEVRAAMAFALRDMKLVAEPGGAVALAAVLAGKIDCRDRTVGLIISGGNVDLDQLTRLVAQ